MLTHLLYARRSSDSEDRQALSISSQIHELRILAERRGIIIGKVFEESRSARIPGRPVFATLMDEVLRGRADGLLCWRLDRLARNPVDGGALVWALDSGKLTKIVTPEREYLNTATDKFWLQLEFGIAKKYVDDLSENVKRGNRAKLEQGWAPGVPPLGYLNDRLGKTIVPDLDRFPLVRRLWELILMGTVPKAALRQFNGDWGVRTRRFGERGGQPLTESAFYGLLHNRFYYGLIERAGQVYRGAHLPMITKAEFDTVQSLVTGKRRRTVHHAFPYARLFSCGSCGAVITGELHVKSSGKRYTYYRCSRNRSGRPCREQAVTEASLDNQIHAVVRALDVSTTELPALRERLAGPQPNSRFAQVRQQSQERTRNELMRQRTRLLDLHLQGLIDQEEFEIRRAQLAASIDALGANLDQDLGVTLRLDGRPLGEGLIRYLAAAEPEAGKILLRKLGNWTVRDRRVHLEPAPPLRIVLPGGVELLTSTPLLSAPEHDMVHAT